MGHRLGRIRDAGRRGSPGGFRRRGRRDRNSRPRPGGPLSCFPSGVQTMNPSAPPPSEAATVLVLACLLLVPLAIAGLALINTGLGRSPKVPVEGRPARAP